MKSPAILKTDESLLQKHTAQASQTPAIAREKLSALTHRIQLIIRNRPKDMLRVLEFYQYFLSVKEDLEHYFTREQSLLRSLNQEGGGPASNDTRSLSPDKSLMLGKTLARLKEELSGFVVLLSNLQINHKGLKAYSLALSLFFKELENFVRLLDAHKAQLSYASLPVPPPAGTIALGVPFVSAANRGQDRIRA
jgi:hypothetical protein